MVQRARALARSHRRGCALAVLLSAALSPLAGLLWTPPPGRAARPGATSAAAAGVIELQAPGPAADAEALRSPTSPYDEYADQLFAKYDEDGSGQIDREEFKVIAEEMRADATRRTALAMFTSALGATAVAEYSPEYQFLQRTFRGLYADRKAESAMNAYFPTAMLSADTLAQTTSVLASRGFTPENTLFAHSVCPDEVNAKAEELVYLMSGHWGEAFTLGGLAGVPFAGKSGFGAYLHHTPVNGKILIMFAPHVGITQTGQVGAVLRSGQERPSTACGAAVGAFKALQGGAAAGSGTKIDAQEDYIKQQLAPRLEGIEAAPDEIAYVAYQNYAIARDLLFETLAATPDLFDWATEVAILGGIMVNRKTGGDFFQPMLFQSRTKGGVTLDMFEQAFGKKPDLAPVLGSTAAASKML